MYDVIQMQGAEIILVEYSLGVAGDNQKGEKL